MRASLVFAALAAFAAHAFAAPLGTAFTFQGELRDAAQPASGPYDFEFRLYQQPAGGAQLGATVTRDDVAVGGGRFATDLDFGNAQFAGDAQWLEIGVRAGASGGAYTVLQPRQPVSAVPYALGARHALSDSVTGNSVIDGSLGFADIDVSQVQSRVTGTCPSGLSIRGVTAAGTVACNDANSRIDSDGEGGLAVFVYVRQKLVMDGGVPFGMVGINLASKYLEFVPCDDAACARNGTLRQLSSPSTAGVDSFDAAMSQGVLVAAAVVDGNMSFYHCQNRRCSTNDKFVVTPGHGSGDVSVAIASDGNAWVAFASPTASLVLYRCGNATCSTGTLRVLPHASAFSREIYVRADQRPIVFFQNNTQDVAVYDCADVTCASGTMTVLDATGDRGGSLAAQPTPGGWLLAYNDESLIGVRGYECTNTNCTAGSSFPIFGNARAGFLAARAGAYPLVTITDRTSGLQQVIDCGGPACTPLARIGIGTTDVRDFRLRSDGRPVMVRNAFGDSLVHTCGSVGCF